MGKYLLRTKIVLDKRNIEQVSLLQSVGLISRMMCIMMVIITWLNFIQYVAQFIKLYREKPGDSTKVL